jgi:hypothetical protein
VALAAGLEPFRRSHQRREAFIPHEPGMSGARVHGPQERYDMARARDELYSPLNVHFRHHATFLTPLLVVLPGGALPRLLRKRSGQVERVVPYVHAEARITIL